MKGLLGVLVGLVFVFGCNEVDVYKPFKTAIAQSGATLIATYGQCKNVSAIQEDIMAYLDKYMPSDAEKKAALKESKRESELCVMFVEGYLLGLLEQGVQPEWECSLVLAKEQIHAAAVEICNGK